MGAGLGHLCWFDGDLSTVGAAHGARWPAPSGGTAEQLGRRGSCCDLAGQGRPQSVLLTLRWALLLRPSTDSHFAGMGLTHLWILSLCPCIPLSPHP